MALIRVHPRSSVAKNLPCLPNHVAFGKMPSVPHLDGPIAQSVEQLAFNQWVAGSSPARLNSLPINSYGLQPLSHSTVLSLLPESGPAPLRPGCSGIEIAAVPTLSL